MNDIDVLVGCLEETLTITCFECGQVRDTRHAPFAAVEAAVKLTQDGWQVGPRQRPVCPTCVEAVSWRTA